MIFVALTAMFGFTPVTVKVDGRGFMRFDHNGQPAYAAQATLTVRGGVLATTEGDTLLPEIAIPANTGSISIGLDGTVRSTKTDLGRIVLVQLSGERSHVGMFSSVAPAKLGNPGEGLFGVIRVAGSKSASVARSGKTSVIVHLRTELETASYTLGDIADIDAPDVWATRIKDISLGSTPSPGVERLVSAPYIYAKMRALGLTLDQFSVEVPDGAKVAVKSQAINPEDLIANALKAIQDKFEIAIKIVPVRIPSALMIPAGDFQISTEIATPNSSSVDVSISVIQAGRTVGTRTISFAPEPGTPQVRAGEKVVVRITQNGATIEIEGRAMSAGFAGQTINVQTTAAPVTTFSGTVKSAGVVEVRI